MTEQDRAPLIRLPIDQEVYMDTVQEGTVVEDATVATEVVSFERVGDAYVLEGAIIFAGYVSQEAQSESNELDVQSGDVEHFHQRLPFVLRVPIQSQPRGILNVKSRLSGWQLSIAGRGWLRVEGELQVAGLLGDDGYHFECGGQQLGHPLFEMVTRGFSKDKDFESMEESPPEDPADSDRGTDTPLSNEHTDATVETPLFRNSTAGEDFNEVIEKVSEARHGYGIGDREAQPPETAEYLDQSRQQELEKSAFVDRSNVTEIHATDDLANFDRFFANDSHFESQKAITERAFEKKTVAEFEFEHQLSPDEMTKLEEKASQAKAQQNESFVASRSFTNDGFHATAGFSHQFNREVFAQQVAENLAELTDDASDGESEFAEDSANSKRYEDTGQEKLWSFVDFNAPDHKYTLKYVIVLEEETLETIADRIHCTKSELMRVNKLEMDSVTPGQTLQIPETPFTFAK